MVSSRLVPVVGLEIHMQLAASTKLFDRTESVLELQRHVNNHVSFFDAALPGTMPIVTEHCVTLALRACGAFNFRVDPNSRFDRKHYFYFDLPAGYQITQNERPLATKGRIFYHVLTKDFGVYKKSTVFERLQLEQDSGKSIHDALDEKSLVDLNRANMPLIELVTEPNMQNGVEAAALVREFQTFVTNLGITKGRMDHGDIRVDANVSLADAASGERFPKVEVKNISGLKFLTRAVDYEIQRQFELSESELRSIHNETRYYDNKARQTRPMRTKEVFYDYRYMPEPNLLPLKLDCEFIATHAKLPGDVKAPCEIVDAWISLGVGPSQAVCVYQAELFKKITLEYFSKFQAQPKEINAAFVDVLWRIYRLLCQELKCVPGTKGWDMDIFVEISTLFAERFVTWEHTKQLLLRMIEGRLKPPVRDVIVKAKWVRITDRKRIEGLCKAVIDQNELVAQKYAGHKGSGLRAKRLIAPLVEQVMVDSNFCVDLFEAKEVLHDMIKKSTLR